MVRNSIVVRLAAPRQVLAWWCIGLLLLQHSATKPVRCVAATKDSGLQGFNTLQFASSAQHLAAFEAVRNYTHQLPAIQRLNGIVNAGANARLRAVVNKLINGEHVRVGVVGGSISHGYGVDKGKTDWFSLFTRYLQAAFPSALIKAHNGALHSAHSEFIGVCLEKLVGKHVDLVFVEVSANDGYVDASVNNPRSHSFERLIRKILKLPNKPAVVVINALQPSIKHLKLPFYQTIEDHYSVICQYYQLPWLSLRDSIWQGLISNHKGSGVRDIYISMETVTQRHLSDLGHKYVADLAVELIQQTFADLMLQPLALDDLLEAGFIPQPMFPHNYEHQGLACAAGLDLKGAALPNHTDWHFVNDGTGHTHKWTFASHTPGSTLLLKLNTQINAEHPIPQLTLYQKVHILTQHGMLAAAAALQQKVLHLPKSFNAPEAAAAVAPAVQGYSEAVQDGGLAAAMAESDRQAAAAAELLQSGQYQFPRGQNLLPGVLQPVTGLISMTQPPNRGVDRIIGVHGGRFQLPVDAMNSLGVTKTHTGVEVVLGRRLASVTSDQAGIGQPAGLHDDVRAAPASSAATPDHSSSSGGGSRATAVTDTSPGAGHGRTLQARGSSGGGGSSRFGVIPPPADAVYLRPGVYFSAAAGSSGSSAAGMVPIPAANAAAQLPGATAQLPGAASPLDSTPATLLQPTLSSSARLQEDMVVWIGFVRSDHMMGRARIQCISGCSCQTLVIDAWHRQAGSLAHMIRLRTTQSPECLIGVEVIAETSSGGHKFKVTGVMVGRAVEYDQAGGLAAAAAAPEEAAAVAGYDEDG